MKDENQVFVSYGHVEEDMCKDICTYLSENGFKPWVDTSKLQHGMLWRDEIRKGIEDSGQVVALLSAYSTRDRGVCLDEISIAVGVTGGNIHTILLQEENIINVPPTIGFEQWFDMSDWKKKKAEGDQAYNEWFKAKMDDVIRRLRDPEHVEKYGQITELRKKLNVQYAVGRQQKLLNEHYTGRKWLGEKIDAWLEDPNAPRRCLVTGAPGVGKSAFAVHYAHYNPKTAAALFFSADMPNYNDPCVVIQTLAYLLACRLSAYRKSLLWELDREDRAALAKLTEKELFDKLITKPLSQAINGNHPAMCIILDGLEECGDPQKNTLAKTIARYADSLPWWLHILIVARDVPAVKNYTKNALRIEMHGEDKDNLEDIRAYYTEALEEKFGNDPAWPETLEQITARSQGIFLYAKMLTNLLLDKGTLNVGGDYPKGLSEVFTLWFDWFFPDGEDYARRWRLPIGCVLGSPEPIPAQTLRRVFDWSENELADFEARLSILLRKDKNVFGDETLVFDHDFVKEWLSSGAGENFYFSSPEDGRRKMADALYAVFEEDAEELTYWEAVQLRDLPLKKCALEKIEENLELTYITYEAISYYLRHGKIDEALEIGENELLIAKKRYRKEEKDPFLSGVSLGMTRMGDIYRARGDMEVALLFYKKALSIDKRLALSEENEQSQHDLSVSYEKVGDVFNVQGRYKEALEMYQESLSIIKELVKQNEDYEKELAGHYNNIGKIMEEKGCLTKALEAYESALGICKRISKREKSITARRYLATSYSHVGDIKSFETNNEAIKLYESSLQIYKEIAEKTKEIVDLSEVAECYCDIAGQIIKTNGNIETAESMCQKALDIFTEIDEKCGTRFTKHNLACCYNHMGCISSEKGFYDKAIEWFEKELVIIKELSEKTEIITYKESVAMTYKNIGYIKMKEKDLDSALEYYRKAYDIFDEISEKVRTAKAEVNKVACYQGIKNVMSIKKEQTYAKLAIGKIVNGVKNIFNNKTV